MNAKLLNKLTTSLSLALVLVLVVTTLAFADNVVNDVTVGGTDTFTAPGSTVIGYKVNATGSDGCNASDGTPVTVTLSVPADVSASTTSLEFNACKDFQNVTFSSSTPGTYAIIVSSISDSGAGTYKNEADFTLNVLAPPPPADSTAPVITINSPVNGAFYLLNEAVTPKFSCTDEAGGSGVKSCIGPATVDTTSVGEKSFTVNAEDNAGNTNTASVRYSVIYKWTGFFQPVDNGKLNIAKAGQAIPLKWLLTDANGKAVVDLSTVKVTTSSLSCALGITADDIEEYAAGASGLQNLGDGYYQFNWKTPTTYANLCKTVFLDLGDGATSDHMAQFQFKK